MTGAGTTLGLEVGEPLGIRLHGAVGVNRHRPPAPPAPRPRARGRHRSARRSVAAARRQRRNATARPATPHTNAATGSAHTRPSIPVDFGSSSRLSFNRDSMRAMISSSLSCPALTQGLDLVADVHGGLVARLEQALAIAHWTRQPLLQRLRPFRGRRRTAIGRRADHQQGDSDEQAARAIRRCP